MAVCIIATPSWLCLIPVRQQSLLHQLPCMTHCGQKLHFPKPPPPLIPHATTCEIPIAHIYVIRLQFKGSVVRSRCNAQMSVGVKKKTTVIVVFVILHFGSDLLRVCALN